MLHLIPSSVQHREVAIPLSQSRKVRREIEELLGNEVHDLALPLNPAVVPIIEADIRIRR